MKLGNISDSAAGATEEQIQAQTNYNAALLSAKVKKCPMYVVFHALYSEHPSVNPVINTGMKAAEVRVGNIEEQGRENDEGEEAQEQSSKSSKNSATSKETKETKGGFKLKEGAKKVDFTTAWTTTMGEAKKAKLDFEVKKEKREREERRKDRKMQEKKIKSDLVISLLARNCNEDQIKTYLRLAGHYVQDAENFNNV
jgi:hypothetical protein